MTTHTMPTATMLHWGRLLPKIIGVLVALLGIGVLVSWFDLTWLRSALPGRVTMKESTALFLAVSGIGLWARSRNTCRICPLGAATAVFCLITGGVVALDAIGVIAVRVTNETTAVQSLAPGVPSIVGLAALLMFNVAVLNASVSFNNHSALRMVAFVMVALTGLVGLIGHLVDSATLTFYGAHTTRMAFHTAGALFLLGLGGVVYATVENWEERVRGGLRPWQRA